MHETGTTNNVASKLSPFLSVIALLSACDLWPMEAKYDPLRCSPSCASGQMCFQGRCLAADSSVADVETQRDSATQDTSAPNDVALDGPTPDLLESDSAAKDGAVADGRKDGPMADLLGPDMTNPCGNGKLEPSEECDGTLLDGKDCNALGCMGGQLSCDSGCRFDKSQCAVCTCGNSAVDMGEECDETNLNGKTCASFGYTGYELACKADCTFDKSGCCGDGTLGGAEQCDGANLGGASCASLGYAGSGLICKSDCTFDKTACCGDGTVGAGEQCDGASLGGQTCQLLGFEGGTPACASDCKSFVTSGCYKCGDGVINGTEQCDGTQFGGKTCVTESWSPGTLACGPTCQFDTTNCGGVVTLAGDGTGAHLDGPALSASFYTPSGLAVDGNGDIFVTEGNAGYVRLLHNGVVSSLTGGGQGFADGAASVAQFWGPGALVVDAAGAVYVADGNNQRIRKIAGGQVSTTAGSGGYGFQNGAALSATFRYPLGVDIAANGDVYVADQRNHVIRRISGGQVTTFAGTGTAGYKDGSASVAMFNWPIGVTVAADGTVYVADETNHAIRMVSGGQVTTLAGTGVQGYQDGLAATAMFNNPRDIILDAAGKAYVSDYSNRKIRVIFNGLVSTLAGGNSGYRDGALGVAQFASPAGLGMLGSKIVVADSGNNRIRLVTP